MSDEMTPPLPNGDQREQYIEALEKKIEASQSNFEYLRIMMSHDLRTSLSAVIGFSRLLLETPMTTQQFENVQTIQNAGLYLLEFVNNYSYLIKIESEQVELEQYPVDVCEIAQAVIKGQTERAEKEGITLTYHIGVDVPLIVASDQSKLQTLLVQLMKYGMSLITGGTTTLNVTSEPIRDETYDQLVTFVVQSKGNYRGLSTERTARLQRMQEFFDQESVLRLPVDIDSGPLLCKKLGDLLGGAIQLQDAGGDEGLILALRLPSQTIPQFSGQTIGIITLDKKDQRFCHSLMAHSNNGDEAWLGELKLSPSSWNSPGLITAPLHFDFNPQPIRFLQSTNWHDYHLKSYLFVQSVGIIVWLSGQMLDVEFLTSADIDLVSFKETLTSAYEIKQPLIIVVEDIRGQAIEVETPAEIEYIQEGVSEIKIAKPQPSRFFTLEDDIWQPDSPTMATIRDRFKIPNHVPILPYSSDNPASINTFLTTLLTLIDDENKE